MNDKKCITKNKMKKNISKKLEWDFNVPDNKNDILKICSVFVDGFITDTDFKEGALNVSLTLKANILYIPQVPSEYEPKICCLETEESFSIQADVPDSGWDSFDTCLFIKNETADIINSRKASVKANASICVNAIKNAELNFKIPEGIAAETKKEQISAVYIPVMFSEKINFTHTLSVPNAKPDIKELLRSFAQIKNKEIKAVTGKAVFKGNLEIKIIYISVLNTVECFEASIPFTEISDAKGLCDNMEMMLSAGVRNLSSKVYSNDDKKNRNIDVMGYMLFGLCAWEKTNADIICDAFSPEYNYECLSEKINYSDISKLIVSQHTKKDTIEFSDEDISEICDITPKIHIKEAVVSDNSVEITADILYDIIYKADGEFKCEKKAEAFQFSHNTPQFENYTNADISCEIQSFSYMIISGNSVEIRSNLLFETRLTKEYDKNIVSEIKINDKEKKDIGRAPIVAYYPNEKECLFDIAKKYNTTVCSLKEINSLKDDFVEEKTFLIIE